MIFDPTSLVDDLLREQLTPKSFPHVGRRYPAFGQFLLKRLVRDVRLCRFERFVELAVGHVDFQLARLPDQDVLKNQVVEQAQLGSEDILFGQGLRRVPRPFIGFLDFFPLDFTAIDHGPRVR